jgi:hypothetical protein
VDILHLTPEQMAAALLEAAEAERWNHWKHEVKQHASDWMSRGDMRRSLRWSEFARLPIAVANYPFVEFCVYRYRRRVVWGYFCKKLPFEGHLLRGVFVVLDPAAGEVIHCMQPERGKNYADRWGKQEKLFIPIRW